MGCYQRVEEGCCCKYEGEVFVKGGQRIMF